MMCIKMFYIYHIKSDILDFCALRHTGHPEYYRLVFLEWLQYKEFVGCWILGRDKILLKTIRNKNANFSKKRPGAQWPEII